ncbi:MAG: histidine kinase [Bacteroidetes bacterium GWC2_33_15]|nr:MAG: histidine kinase [Bacteroidetes bacterium GWA2_33_15]OFX52171.1 MAG: histidine kinase [Bacteroidetes bacterium GWC2_33_15]OFX64325.1 MAG: histidine kinase [Bacteroidetes bacterium GWB2_32_14]OFX67730.1 MAG: histidine kinase [Bacteroidetes bacterium GWD2_33_33]HAN19341.1 histidine kinase [Bacteroidales bacterium]
MTDLTDKELIDELKKRFEQNKRALEEVHELNNELKNANLKLEESEALKSHFISNITNEIINPFASILALSKNILSVDKENWKKVISMISLIYSEAFNLDFQLRNIFVAAKLEAGEIYPEILNVDIKYLIDSVIESFKYVSKKKKLSISFNFNIPTEHNKPVFFKSDPEKLRLILSNLLSNAVKFSADDKSIEITASMEKKNLIISVKDNGTGISLKNQKIIFDRFKRLDSGINSINRGHGLGLSINKALLDLLNGTIKVESSIGKGANFIISIPENDSQASGFSFDGNELFFDDESILNTDSETF